MAKKHDPKLVNGVVVRPTAGASGIEDATQGLIGCLALLSREGGWTKLIFLTSMVKLKGCELELNVYHGKDIGWYYDYGDYEYVGTLEEFGLTEKDFG